MRKGVAIWLLLATMLSCNDRSARKARILPPEKMSTVLWDVIRVDAFTTSFIRKDTTRDPVLENARLQQRVFAEHQVSREDFYASFEYYKKNSAQFKPIMDSMVIRKTREKNLNSLQTN
ncbi:MAG: DUF4296 domain-containing protein [Chitinophagaceae bacterium]|nr:DUF4296 domain-containing protein [Chitinophagaceae bacterium]MBL0056056.1 DUF4296 domain-containing protein [Chitinophagaceae bacterium]